MRSVDGTIAGAGLDVYEQEPQITPALLTMENVVLLPHLGSATTRDARGDGHAGSGKSSSLLQRRPAQGSRGVTHVAAPAVLGAGAPGVADPAAASAAALRQRSRRAALRACCSTWCRRRAARGRTGAARASEPPAELSPELLARALQVQGIWFQLLSIAEQNAAMRRRRQIEAERGYEQLRGTFAQVISERGGRRVPAPELRELLEILRVRPVITAHPTEAKRVTVLEKHRRIYRRLVDLESPRWTPRERQRAASTGSGTRSSCSG